MKNINLEIESHSSGKIEGAISSASWSENSNFISLGSTLGEIVIIDLIRNNIKILQEKNDNSIDSIGFNHNNNYLMATGQLGELVLWEMGVDNSYNLIEKYSLGANWIDHASWQPKGSRLSVAIKNKINFWNSTNKIWEKSNIELNNSVQSLSWSKDGELLSACSSNELLVSKNMHTEGINKLCKSSCPSAGISVSFSDSGKYLACGQYDKSMMIWKNYETDRPNLIKGFPSKVNKVIWSEIDNKLQLASLSYNLIILWNKKNEVSDSWKPMPLKPCVERINSIEYSPRNPLLVSTGLKSSLNFWDQNGLLLENKELDINEGINLIKWDNKGKYIFIGGKCGNWIILRIGLKVH